MTLAFCGSGPAAARSLGVSKAAVSKRLALLERRSGLPPFNRSTRRMSLTPEGEAAAEPARRILGAIEDIQRLQRRSREVPRGPQLAARARAIVDFLGASFGAACVPRGPPSAFAVEGPECGGRSAQPRAPLHPPTAGEASRRALSSLNRQLQWAPKMCSMCKPNDASGTPGCFQSRPDPGARRALASLLAGFDPAVEVSMKLLVKSLVAAALPVLAVAAVAAQPWISVPSTPSVDQRMVINGGDLGPGAPVVLRIQHPSGAVTTHALAADASGRLRFEYTLAATGSYTVEAVDATGKVIGAGRLGHFR